MAPDAGGDSLHVGLDGATPDGAANTSASSAQALTGFAPNAWTWSRLTMSNTNATLDLTAGGTYTLNVAMREACAEQRRSNGLRLDKLLLTTDDATTPGGQGPAESAITCTLPALSSHTISYSYDPLYRLTGATYSGAISADYAYTYDAVGNMTAYTETIGAETTPAAGRFLSRAGAGLWPCHLSHHPMQFAPEGAGACGDGLAVFIGGVLGQCAVGKELDMVLTDVAG